MIDKRFADRMVHAFRHDEVYRLNYRGCPCCGSEDDDRRPFENWVLHFIHSGTGIPGSSEWFESYYCGACGSYFTALFRGNRLVGFSEEIPPNPFESDSTVS